MGVHGGTRQRLTQQALPCLRQVQPGRAEKGAGVRSFNGLGFIGLTGFLGFIGLIGFIGFIGLIGFRGLAFCNSPKP